MRVTTLAQSPVFGGKVRHVDDSAAKSIPGVRQIIVLDDFVAVVGDHGSSFELDAQRRPQRSVDPRPSAHLRLLQQLEAAVERELPQPVVTNAHVPSTSTLPEAVTRTLTRSRCGSG